MCCVFMCCTDVVMFNVIVPFAKSALKFDPTVPLVNTVSTLQNFCHYEFFI